jgi:serine/threonine protein kinase
MGTTVYVGIMEDGSEVAVKRMLTQACEDSARNEIEILNRTDTNKSPFIVSYRHFYDDGIFMYLILDLCEETLKEHVNSQTTEHLRKHGPRMIKEILTGLQFLHSLGILHRDLKPTNVLVDVEGHMRLADFGVSRVLNEDETTVYTDAKGTRDWMPVEVIEAINKRQKCRFKKKSDVQAVGMMGFFILTKGEHPFGPSSVDCMTNILQGNPVNLSKLPNLGAREFVAWLISHSISERPYAHEALSHSFMDQVEEFEVFPKLMKRQ